jgi:hypothetical protein
MTYVDCLQHLVRVWLHRPRRFPILPTVSIHHRHPPGRTPSVPPLHSMFHSPINNLTRPSHAPQILWHIMEQVLTLFQSGLPINYLCLQFLNVASLNRDFDELLLDMFFSLCNADLLFLLNEGPLVEMVGLARYPVLKYWSAA